MSIKRIIAVLTQEYFMIYRSVETFFDIFVFSFISLLLFGFFSSYLVGENNVIAAQYLLLGMLFWEVVRVVQYAVTIASLWNLWSRNLSNMFISPVSMAEYIAAHTLSAILRGGLVFIINAFIAAYVFRFSVFDLGVMVWIYFLLFAAFAFSAGLVILGTIFRFGTRIQAFAWGIVPILQPLTAAFFPVSILPKPLQTFAWLFPITYVFEAARFQLDTGQVDWQLIFSAILLNVVYAIFAVFLFSWLFRASRDSGQFARNET